MYLDVRKLEHGIPCAVRGFGYTELPDDCGYDNTRFIQQALTETGYQQMIADLELGSLPQTEAIAQAAQKFVDSIGITRRYIFPGNTAELGTLAAEACLRNAGVSASDLSAIVVGTNTGHGYPSTADLIKQYLGQPSPAMCYDVAEACPSGVLAIFQGWLLVRSGVSPVLVVGVDKTSTLASRHDWKGFNLFGDAAFAWLLTAGQSEEFLFFDFVSDPFGGLSELVVRGYDGFFRQDGPAVHRYVAKIVPQVVERCLAAAAIDPLTIKHVIPHQPSAKTLDLLVSKFFSRWPTWRESVTVHRNIEVMGNTSAACTGWLIGRGIQTGLIKPGELCLVTSFGAGMSLGTFAFAPTLRP